eukprot:scaffold3375_cov153-Cylindrotheca_fusiformis.AAC.4
MSAEEVAKAFTQHYYQAVDTNVESLAGLFVSFRNRSPVSPVASMITHSLLHFSAPIPKASKFHDDI